MFLSCVKTLGNFIIMYWITSITFDGSVIVEAKIWSGGIGTLLFRILEFNINTTRHLGSWLALGKFQTSLCNACNLYNLSLLINNGMPAESA